MAHSHVPVMSQSTPGGSASHQPGVARGLRIAGNFTLSVTAFYDLVLLGAIFASIALTGNAFFPDLGTNAGLAYTAQYPTAVTFGYIADAVGNTVVVVTIAAVFVALRTRWPMWAQLILLAGFGSLLAVWGKALVSIDMASSLSASYLAAGTVGKATLLPLGGVAAAIRQGLQDLDTYFPHRRLDPDRAPAQSDRYAASGALGGSGAVGGLRPAIRTDWLFHRHSADSYLGNPSGSMAQARSNRTWYQHFCGIRAECLAGAHG